MKKYRVFCLLMALLCTLLLCCPAISASGSSSIYLMAVNDTVKPDLAKNNMPVIFNDTLYVPYTMLSYQATGVNLGVRAQYNPGQGTVTVTDDVRTVVFDIRKSTATASTGELVLARAMVRNSMAYLPIHWLCAYFEGLNYSMNSTPYGTLVRVSNPSRVLTDVEFINAANELLRLSLQRYQNEGTQPDPGPDPTPTVTTTPGPVQDRTPLVFLAFRWGSCVAEAADMLELAGQRGLFLIPAEELPAQDDLIRRLVGRGHQVGLLLEGNDLVSCMDQLVRGRSLLEDIARTSVVIVSAEDLNFAGRGALADEGCALWEATLKADGMTESEVLRRLSSRSANYVELTADEGTAVLLVRLVTTLGGEEYRLRQALAPLL